MPRISAFVITHNEGTKIADCLASLQWLDEVVVVDDDSTDATEDVCRQYGVRFFRHPFTGFKDQKSYAMTLTANDWVLELDADERVSPTMRESIIALADDDFERFAGFEFKRLTCFWGKWIRHASFYPDYKVRLYNKCRGVWSEGNVHERFIPEGKPCRLAVDIVHSQDLDLPTYLQRTARYANLSALDMHARGKQARWHHFTIRPFYTFAYRYFVRLGFLDGIQGFVISVMGGIGTFLKYMRLYEMERRMPASTTGKAGR